MRPVIGGCYFFFENYAKRYIDAKHLEKGLNGGGEIFEALFSKKVFHYVQRKAQVCFNSISTDSDYHNAVICLCLWAANNALIFAVFFLFFVACHVTFNCVVETPTLPQVVFSSLILYNDLFYSLRFVWGVSLKFQI